MKHSEILFVCSLCLLPHCNLSFILPGSYKPHRSPLTVLTGIKGFRSWYSSTFPTCITPLTNTNSSSTFTHVLIDVNQLLHITLRRGRSEGHGLTMLLKELDKCLDLATPLKSVVLALDGPASAAKLTTQRRRRYGVVIRSNVRRERQKLLGMLEKRSKVKEEATLCITPGTHFMTRAENAILYWAWQRLSSKYTTLARNNVKIYLSTSEAAGEGEVKLLDWLLSSNKAKMGDSVAIMGGDSDLVLEGLILPPKVTHNLYVILPHKTRQSYAVSLWETTRQLDRFLEPHLQPQDIMRVRTDLVLLLIMNGNDYLPKLRGSSGFRRLFHAYLTLLKQWLQANKQHPFLCSPNYKGFNLPFTLAFFRKLSKSAPKIMPTDELPPYQNSVTPLSNLNILIDSGFLPRPAKWTVIPSSIPQHETVKLTLGMGEKQMEFAVDHREGTNLKSTKHRLASIAMEDILGEDWEDFNDYSRNSVNGDYEGDVTNDGDDDVTIDDDDDRFSAISPPGYPWEISKPVECDVSSYLNGLLWNLQTYQEGVCADYAYNYGRKMSPTASEMVAFLKNHTHGKNPKLSLTREDLFNNTTQQKTLTFTLPMNAKLSCLAALPLQAKHLVPEPHSYLTEDGKIEDIYEQCMDPNDNVFDLKLFQQKCMDALQQIVQNNTNITATATQQQLPSDTNSAKSSVHGRKIYTSPKYWTVLSRSNTPLAHPFAPPEPFSDRLSPLRGNPYIKATRIWLTTEPSWVRKKDHHHHHHHHHLDHKKTSISSKVVDELLPTPTEENDVSWLLGPEKSDNWSIQDIEYHIAYEDARKQIEEQNKMKNKSKDRMPTSLQQTKQGTKKHKKRHRINGIINTTTNTNEMKSQKKKQFDTNIESHTPLSCLQCLADVKSIPNPIKWEITATKTRETVRLILGENNFVYDSHRDVNGISRQRLKHHLASLALDRIVGKKWREKSLKEMKELSKEVLNIDA